MCIRDRSASGAPSGPLRRQLRHLRKTWRRIHPSGASGAHIEAVSGLVQFRLRMPRAVSHGL
eukprot:9537448-Alexandrium_andersonii.AAC.1